MIVDLSELHFADPSLMIDLACLAQRLRAQGRTLWLNGAQPNIRTLIETVGLHRLPAVRLDGPLPAFKLLANLPRNVCRSPHAPSRSSCSSSSCRSRSSR